MCKAIKYTSQLNKILSDIDKDHDFLNKELSRCDLEQQDILHKIENSTFNACEGYMLAIQLKQLRQNRREIKDEFEAMQSLRSILQPITERIKSAENRVLVLRREQAKRIENKTYKTRVIGN